MLLTFQILLTFSMFVFLTASFDKGKFKNPTAIALFIFTTMLLWLTIYADMIQ